MELHVEARCEPRVVPLFRVNIGHHATSRVTGNCRDFTTGRMSASWGTEGLAVRYSCEGTSEVEVEGGKGVEVNPSVRCHCRKGRKAQTLHAVCRTAFITL